MGCEERRWSGRVLHAVHLEICAVCKQNFLPQILFPQHEFQNISVMITVYFKSSFVQRLLCTDFHTPKENTWYLLQETLVEMATSVESYKQQLSEQQVQTEARTSELETRIAQLQEQAQLEGQELEKSLRAEVRLTTQTFWKTNETICPQFSQNG